MNPFQRLKELVAVSAFFFGLIALLWAGIIQRLLHPTHTSTINLFLNWRWLLAGLLLLGLSVYLMRDAEK